MVLKVLDLTVFTLGGCVAVLIELILTVSTLGGFGSLDKN